MKWSHDENYGHYLVGLPGEYHFYLHYPLRKVNIGEDVYPSRHSQIAKWSPEARCSDKNISRGCLATQIVSGICSTYSPHGFQVTLIIIWSCIPSQS